MLENNSVVTAIKTVFDPEIDVNIYDLGLIYGIEITENNVHVTMTLTSAFCPEAEAIPKMVKDAIFAIGNVGEVTVTVTMDPPWTPEKISDEAKLELGIY